jgi:hypothetical protein
MRHRLWLVIWLCAGCGRVGFDAGDRGDDGGGALDSSGLDAPVIEPDAVPDDARGTDAGDVDGGPDPDLAVWLPMDEPPPVASDATGTLTNGRCAPGRCPFTTVGVFGSAYVFDGVDDYLQFDTSAALDFGDTAQPFSVSVWYRTRSRGPAQQVVLAQATSDGDVSFQISFEDLFGTGVYDVVWKVCELDCPSETFAVFSDGVALDAWRFAVGVWTGTESILFIDALEMARVPTAGVKFDGLPFMLGADYEIGASIEDSFDGAIDELRIYRRVLDADDQTALMVGAAR